MRRRDLLQTLLTLPTLGLARATQANIGSILIQDSPVAGFQYYDGDIVWGQLRVGDELALRRAADNRYDPRAVEVWWRQHQLGHLPRVENHAVAQMLDRGLPLRARIIHLQNDPDPWQRVRLDVHLETAFT